MTVHSLSAALLMAVLAGSLSAQKPTLPAIERALFTRHYQEAVTLADQYLRSAPEDADHAIFLKALALFDLERFSEAEVVAAEVTSRHADSSWLRKARFLQAQALIRQRKHAAAQAIYEEEARRLLSSTRKEEIAGVLLRFADDLAAPREPNDLRPPPDLAKACNLYEKGLALEISRELRDDLMFKLARTRQRQEEASKKHGNRAEAALRSYLKEFDPDWLGPVGSAARLAGQKQESPPPPGQHRYHARLRIAKVLLRRNNRRNARINLEDLLRMLAAPTASEELQAEVRTHLHHEALWNVVHTWGMPAAGQNPDPGIAAVRAYLNSFRDGVFAVRGAFWIGAALDQAGRSDHAITAYEAFLDGRGYALNTSATALKERLVREATFRVARIRFSQKRYQDAITWFERYVNRFPNGSSWAASQTGIINARYMVALDSLAEGKTEAARERFVAFLRQYPLDGRSRKVMFILGQMIYHEAETLDKTKKDPESARRAYSRAASEWMKLVGKYPNTEESSQALYRVGLIREERLGDLENALVAYRQLTWGPKAAAARARVALLTQKELEVDTERTFRTDEKPEIKLRTRNVKSVTVRQYFLDLEPYFRKTHGIGGIEALDIALIQPDKTWVLKIDAYARYKPVLHHVPVPFEDGKAGVCIINISEDDLEATTLVVRSDLDLILKSSRKEALAFVQDRRTGRPAAGVNILLSDGKKIFARGATGKDGVFKGRFSELRDLNSVRVFAIKEGSIASNALNLSGMSLSKGLSARGFIYTDRPAYLPGESTGIRGIIRDVESGSYAIPAVKQQLLSVRDASGRLVWQQDVTLSRFGTFAARVQLAEAATLGIYTISVHPKDRPELAHAGTFKVARFQLKKMRISLETPRQVYYRGEIVEIQATASWFWGEPLRNEPIHCTLPDGVLVKAKTDANGQATFRFDTTGLSGGQMPSFSATLPGEGVNATKAVFVSVSGFAVSVSSSHEIALAGEPFDAVVRSTTPDGKPCSRDLLLTVLLRTAPRPIPVLEGLPWRLTRARESGEVTVAEFKATTDPKTGEVLIPIKLEKGGRYVLRVAGTDRFKQAVSATGVMRVSDDEDATRLRLFSETSRLKVGGSTRLRLHSRAKPGLALMTLEGEEIIEHRIIEVSKGYNDINLDIDHAHFPNFRVAVAMMDERKLLQATRPFIVERQLKVTVRPVKAQYLPGEEGKIELVVTDHLGRPVEAELSLALVNEALYGVHPDASPPILDFFQKGVIRKAEFRAISTCSFAYRGVTRPVIKAVLAEAERRKREAGAAKEYAQSRRRLKDLLGRYQSASEPQAPAEQREEEKSIGGAKLDDIVDGFARFKANKPASRAPRPDNTKGFSFDAGKSAAPRKEIQGAGAWIASVVTGKDGKASLSIPMPEMTTAWRLTSRACTPETLIGEATANVVTRKDFFVSFKAPPTFLEGDEPRLLARIHNLTDWEGEATMTLQVRSNGRAVVSRTAAVKVTRSSTSEVLFDNFRVGSVEFLDLEVSVSAANRSDAVTRHVRVRPWGLEYADHAGGTSTGPVRTSLKLPSGREYGSRWLTISVAPTPNRALVALTLGRYGWTELELKRGHHLGSWGRSVGGELLATIATLDQASAPDMAEDRRRLLRQARALIASLVASQRPDGAWSWPTGAKNVHPSATALAYRALARAAAAGLSVHQKTLTRGQAHLQATFQRTSSNDLHQKAFILHALSVTGHADFAHLNRLYRQRNRLGSADLAALALSFEDQDRHQIALELVSLLEAQASKSGVLAHWDAQQNSNAWMGSRIETTAMALLALARVHPKSALAKPAADWLLSHRGCRAFRPAHARGLVIAALSARFREVATAEHDFRLTITVNDKVLETLAAEGLLASKTIRVPAPSIVEGANRIEFRLEGRGEFTWAATLRGFSSSFKRASKLRSPYVRKRSYRHAPLRYRGRAIAASSSSLVKNVEAGQHVHVHVDISSGRRRGHYTVIEESLPAGFRLLPGSIQGSHSRHEIDDGRLILVVPPGRTLSSFRYEMVGSAAGSYRSLPTIMRDLADPSVMTIGSQGALTILGPGEKSRDVYTMNASERYQLGKAYFDDGRFDQALRYLRELHHKNSEYYERDVARMLLWIATRKGSYDARLIVDMFEILRERYPDLLIPFDKILTVGRAYGDMGEHERSWLVYRATVDASFVKDSNVSAVLQDEGQLMGSIAFQKRLWREYPDTPEVVSSWFALSQSLYKEAPRAEHWAKTAGKELSTPAMLLEVTHMLQSFLILYPDNPLADDAAFSLSNAILDLKDYKRAVSLSEEFSARYPKSEHSASFRYIAALGHFWQRNYEPALAAAKRVAEGKTKDQNLAQYILGQIHHAQGNATEAIRWYELVKKQYPDAREAIDYFQHKRISLPEVTIFEPGKPVAIKVKYRNIKEAALQVYKVDLMRLYLREKSLKNVTGVNLAGIASQLELKRALGDGRDYRNKEVELPLQLTDEGAYLVICRGDDLFTSGLVLVTPLKIEAQEDARSGRVRVNVMDVANNRRPAGVHVKVIGSGDSQFRSGETDLRGLFVADDVNGRTTVIARDGDSRYAFYRGTRQLGSGDPSQRGPRTGNAKQQSKSKVNYRTNLSIQNRALQDSNVFQFESLRRQTQKGVEIRKAK